MAYKPFSIDKDTLKQIYEIDDASVDEVFRVATGADLLQKNIDEVSPHEIEEFVSYQKNLQIVNQFLGMVPMQPDDFDIEACVIQTLKENCKKSEMPTKERYIVEYKAEVIQKKLPIHDLKPISALAWCHHKRMVLYYLSVKKVNLTEEQVEQLLKVSFNKRRKVA